MPTLTLEQANQLIAERAHAVKLLEAEREELRREREERSARWALRRAGTAEARNLLEEQKQTRKLYLQLSRVMYALWKSMHARCQRDPLYMGRISVCPRWSSFHNFWADMGDRPSPSHSLGRINNDGPYAPENVRWETVHQQAGNRRTGKPSSSGVVGVSWEEGKQRWVAVGVVKGVRQVLYRGKDLEQAILCRQAWEAKVRAPVLDLPLPGT